MMVSLKMTLAMKTLSLLTSEQTLVAQAVNSPHNSLLCVPRDAGKKAG